MTVDPRAAVLFALPRFGRNYKKELSPFIADRHMPQVSEQRHRRLITKKIDRHSATFRTGGFRSGPAHPSLGQVLGISSTLDRRSSGGYGSGSSGIGSGGSAGGNGQAGAGLTFSDFLDALALVSKVRRGCYAGLFHVRLSCSPAHPRSPDRSRSNQLTKLLPAVRWKPSQCSFLIC